MAFPTLPKWQATVTLRDSAQRDTSVSIYVSKTNADLWNNAANQAAREATPIGAWYLALLDMTQCNPISVSVASGLQENLPVTPDSGLRGNKAVFTVSGSTGTKQQTTIPAYIVLNLPVEDDNLTIDVGLSTPTEWGAYKTAFLAVALTNEGNTVAGFITGKLND